MFEVELQSCGLFFNGTPLLLMLYHGRHWKLIIVVQVSGLCRRSGAKVNDGSSRLTSGTCIGHQWGVGNTETGGTLTSSNKLSFSFLVSVLEIHPIYLVNYRFEEVEFVL